MPLLHGLLYIVAVLAFTLFDVYGYGDLVQSKKLNLTLYRVLQGALELAIDVVLILNNLWFVAAGFELCHFGFGCDGLYYVFRNEKYIAYTITWFPLSIPSLIFKAVGKPFMGYDLRWIFMLAISAGFVVSIL